MKPTTPMRPVRYVNHLGQTVDPAHLPRRQPKPKTPALHRTEDLLEATKHFGFEVVGISEDTVREAEGAWHAKRAKDGQARAEFDREAFLNRTKPRRAIGSVFTIPEAAEQAAGMLRAGGGMASRAGCRHLEGVMRC